MFMFALPVVFALSAVVHPAQNTVVVSKSRKAIVRRIDAPPMSNKNTNSLGYRNDLKPEGLLFFEEVTSYALGRWFYRRFLEHPLSQHCFGKDLFISELERQGILVGNNVVERFFGDFIIGVGRPCKPHHRKKKEMK